MGDSSSEGTAGAGLAYRGLGYVGVATPDPKAFRDFATDVCGLMPSSVLPGPRPASVPVPSPDAHGIADDGTAYLKLDERQWRVAAHPGDAPGLRYFGLELEDAQAVEAAAVRLRGRGIEVTAATAAELEARDVGAMVVVHDPAGHRIELFSAPLCDGDFVSAQGAEFLTGRLGMGHIVLFVDDVAGALDFYVGELGFKRSDYMNFGGDMGIHFLRCTPRHHSIALLKVGPPAGLQHLMFEVKTLDQVGLALDRALDRDVFIRSGLGRHRNDRTFSFYMEGPAGFDVEIGFDGLLIGDDWVEHEFSGDGDLWGHHGLTAEALTPDTD